MIRLASAGDKARLMAMARAFHAAADQPFVFSPAHASLLVDACVAGGDYLALVLEVDGKAVGVLAAHAAEHAFAPVKISNEIMIWIQPEYRGGSSILKLIKAYETWAASKGCALAGIVGLGSDPLVGKLYKRLGYQPAERHFMKPLD